MKPTLEKRLANCVVIASMAFDCAQKKFTDEALLHIGMLEAELDRLKGAMELTHDNTKRMEWVAENLKAVHQDIGENWFITHIGENGAEVVTKSEHGFIDAVDRAMDQNQPKGTA